MKENHKTAPKDLANVTMIHSVHAIRVIKGLQQTVIKTFEMNLTIYTVTSPNRCLYLRHRDRIAN